MTDIGNNIDDFTANQFSPSKQFLFSKFLLISVQGIPMDIICHTFFKKCMTEMSDKLSCGTEMVATLVTKDSAWETVSSPDLMGQRWTVHMQPYWHYSDIIMGVMASQITSLTIVHPAVYSGAEWKKTSRAFDQGIHRWPGNSPHKWPLARKMFPFDDIIMETRAVWG